MKKIICPSCKVEFDLVDNFEITTSHDTSFEAGYPDLNQDNLLKAFVFHNKPTSTNFERDPFETFE